MDVARKADNNSRLKEVLRVIGNNIIRLRGHKMSQDDLAAKSGVSRSTIAAAESGEPITLQNLIRIADALGVKPEDLFITEEDRNRVSKMTVMLLDKVAEALNIKKGE